MVLVWGKPGLSAESLGLFLVSHRQDVGVGGAGAEAEAGVDWQLCAQDQM